MLATETFSTDDAPVNRRAWMFNREMAQRFSVGLSISPSERRPLRSVVTAYCGERLRFAALSFSPHTTSPGRSELGAARLLITLQKEGTSIVSQDGRESRIEKGEMFLLDPSRPFSIATGEIRTHSMFLQPAALRALLPQIDALTAMTIPGDSGPGSLFRAYLDQIFTLAPMLDEALADRIADSVPHVLSTALASLTGAQEPVQARFVMLHKQRIRRFVSDNLRDPELDVARVARAVQLSPRYVHQLFSDEQVSLMKFVWSERLERCRTELATPNLQKRAISEIAYDWGFSDVAHFSRAFRERYDMSPREYRARERRGGDVQPDQSCGAL